MTEQHEEKPHCRAAQKKNNSNHNIINTTNSLPLQKPSKYEGTRIDNLKSNPHHKMETKKVNRNWSLV